jgi:hypothetical protein
VSAEETPFCAAVRPLLRQASTRSRQRASSAGLRLRMRVPLRQQRDAENDANSPTVTVKSLTGARAAAASRSHVARCGGCPLLIDDHASANAGDGPRNLRRLANEQAERSEINSLALKHRC